MSQTLRRLLGSLVVGVLGLPTAVAAAPMLTVQPPVTNVFVGDVFTLDVMLSGADDLFAFDVELAFDPAIVQALQLLPGTFLGSTVGTDVDAFSDVIDNGVGEVAGAQSRLVFPGVSGNGVLFGIQFQALAIGSSLVSFDVGCDAQDPFCTELQNSLAEPTGFDSEGGVVHVRARPVPEPSTLWLMGAVLVALAFRRRR